MSLIEIRNVSKRFGDVTALDNVSLDITDREFFSLLGPSGCGKTTLLRILAGFEHPDEGTVHIDGQDMAGVRPNRRPVNMMFQSYALFPHLTVRRNVSYGLEAEGIPRSKTSDRVDETLSIVGLTELGERRPHQISGGQRQRVALARAIVKRPKMLLLDEPLGALDRKVRAEMQLELKRLQDDVGITFVVVTHDQEEAMSMADRIAVLDVGRVLQIATPIELYEQPATRFVADFIGDMNLLAGTASPGNFEVPGVGKFVTTGTTSGPGWIGIRPERLSVGGAGENTVSGSVVDVSFYGAMTHCSVAIPNLDRVVRASLSGPRSIDRGATVILSWDMNEAVVLTE